MKLAILFPRVSHGGIERVLVNLLQYLSAKYEWIDVICESIPNEIVAQLPDNVRIVRIGHTSSRLLFANSVCSWTGFRYLQLLIGLSRYLRSNKPKGLLVFQGSFLAALSVHIARSSTRLVIRESNTPSAIFNYDHQITRYTRRYIKRYSYSNADKIVVNSLGVKDDLERNFEVSPSKIKVIYNPIHRPSISGKALEEIDHSWFSELTETPVIISVGRLTFQKDHETLIKAFARVIQTHCARLVILGEGAQRAFLQRTIAELNLEQVVDLVGHVDNPFAYLSRASIFAMTPRYEGLPNAVIEAVACGLPVVCTDCPSGPREILLDGMGGQLVPVGDVAATANALLTYLDNPSTARDHIRRSQEALNRFDPGEIAQEYISLFCSD